MSRPARRCYDLGTHGFRHMALRITRGLFRLCAVPGVYALVIASLMAPAAALAMADRALPGKSQDNEFKRLFDFLDMIDRNWLGTELRDFDPKSWNGVWPERNSSMAVYFSGGVIKELKGVSPNIFTLGTVLYHEPGGVITEHVDRWQELARSGADVEILDACYSACTLIVAYVPK
jgi:hypothetical protein